VPGQVQTNAFARAHGLVYTGLRRVRGGRCGSLYQVIVPGAVRCTHGPDPSPAGIDVRKRRSLAELRATLRPSARFGKSTATAVPCIGDGKAGDRIQAVYAHPAFAPDRFNQVAPLIRQWAAQVEETYERSAAETGGSRQIRWVTDSSCQLAIRDVVARSDTIDHTILDLKIQQLTAHDRKYLVWMDANVLCGIGESYTDDRPTSDNYNDGPDRIPGMIARIDEGCWGLYFLQGSVEAHELTHTIGAVLGHAPHATKYGHCTDQYDVMCYVDGPGTVLHDACPPSHQQLLDCNHDDYFSTAPTKGSWLATHWNTANNAFLVGGSAPPPAAHPPPPPPPRPTPPPPPPPLKCVVPGVTGQVLSAAVISIMRAHCGLQKATSRYSRKVAAGRVVSQAPKAGAVLAAGGLVTIVYSKGSPANASPTRCVVPRLKHMSLIAAVMRLTRVGCTAKLKQAYSKKVPIGRVVSQAPRAGKILPLRGTVTVVTSKGRRR